MVADSEELKEMYASNSTPELNAKDVLTPQSSGKLHIPSRRWNSQNLWARKVSENIHLNPGSNGTRRRTRNSSRKIG